MAPTSGDTVGRMPTICLLRHGQARFGSDDYDALSELGVEQAVVAAHALAARGIRTTVLVSGSMRRQRSTAQATADVLGLDNIRIDARWDEFDAHGLVAQSTGADAARGMTSAEFQSLLDDALTQWIGSDNEAWRRFVDGPVSAVYELATSVPRGSDAVVVTSAGVIAALCGRLLGAGTAGIVALNRVAVNAAITTLAASEHRVSLVSFNDHAHLLGDRRLLTHR